MAVTKEEVEKAKWHPVATAATAADACNAKFWTQAAFYDLEEAAAVNAAYDALDDDAKAAVWGLALGKSRL